MTESLAASLFGSVYPDGTVFFQEGDPGDVMYVIQEGKVEIARVVGGVRTVLSVLGKGEYFGEMALLDNQPRSASATACGPTRVMVLSRDNLLERIKDAPHVVLMLLRMMCLRLRSFQDAIGALESQGNLDVESLAATLRAHQTN
ncbi:MAG: cyclic nucleotide-binding domain-containing protein [Candidatus Riflebacteria bacterium]|nr:cyclic nucleotide-binding domain-containing protein [Candidatus Riflebacteria bacterium]